MSTTPPHDWWGVSVTTLATTLAMTLAVLTTTAGCSPADDPLAHNDPLVHNTLVVGGAPRGWYAYTPTDLGGRPVPVVIVLHGYGQEATGMPRLTGIDREARHDGFTVAFPEGIERSWNAGGCCGAAVAGHVDDVAFLAALIGDLVGRGVADAGRVYLAGFSNGAMMTYRFACVRPDLLAGAIVVEGTLTSPCAVHRPANLLVIHQTGDGLVPLAGNANPQPGFTEPYPSVSSSVATWLTTMGCANTIDASTLPTPSHPVARAVASCPGGTATQLDVMAGGGHAWPHSPPAPLDATGELATVFQLRPPLTSGAPLH